MLTLASIGGTATYSTTINTFAGGSWLQVSPTSGNASGPLTVSVAPNQLTQGTYTGQIILTLQNASAQSITINVTLNVSAPQSIIVSPSQTFTFSYAFGTSLQPAPQRFRVTSAGAPTAFTVVSASSGWLSTDVTSGTTSQDVNIQVNAAGLTQGTYNGTVTVNAPNSITSPIVLSVVLTVTSPPAPQPITIANNASGVAGVIAPGEIISIYGNNLGPTKTATFTVNSQGKVDSTLSGVRVLFNNNPGTPLYVSPTQINVTVPYEIAGLASTNVVVEYLGVQSTPTPFSLSVTQRAPGIYTLNSQGFGQAAALNQNNTFNGSGVNGTTPAAPDTVVTLYGTGGGQTNPTSATGTVTPSGTTLYRVPNVTATVGGQPAVVEFGGAAPFLVTGVIQFNVHVPKGVTGDALAVVISVDGVSTPQPGITGPTIAVR